MNYEALWFFKCVLCKVEKLLRNKQLNIVLLQIFMGIKSLWESCFAKISFNLSYLRKKKIKSPTHTQDFYEVYYPARIVNM